MTLRLPQLTLLGSLAGLCGLVVLVSPQPVSSQAPAAPAAAPGDPNGNGMEVLARGPIHEAFASSVDQPSDGGPIIPKAPPDAIEELPPDQKPDGDNVQWIPGYWSWDDERQDFLWVSGLWRDSPPNRVWVPGSWRQAAGGSQWVHGFWQEVPPAPAPGQVEQPVNNIQYLPPPPQPLETGPVAPSPDPSSVYIPGSWVWRNHYVWRPGVWAPYRQNWVWVPAHFRWTPAGYVFIDGYWDYPLANRGVLFAPVYFSQPVYAQPAFAYSPMIVVSEPCLYGSLFVRRGYGSYYFGDYFAPQYAGFGYSSWNGIGAGGVAITIGFGGRRGYFYDPLWSYYRATYRNDPTWVAGVNGLYVGRYQGTIMRPPQTFVQQTTVVNNITNNNVTIINRNVTNNTIVNNKMVNNVNNVTMLTTMNNIHHTTNVVGQTSAVRLQPVPQAARVQEQAAARQYHQVAATRAQAETRLVTQGGPATAPRTAQIAMPQAVVARAQAPVHNPVNAPPPKPVSAHTAQVNPAVAAHPQPGVAQPHPGLQPPPHPQPGVVAQPRPGTQPVPHPQPGVIQPHPGVQPGAVMPHPQPPVAQPQPMPHPNAPAPVHLPAPGAPPHPGPAPAVAPHPQPVPHPGPPPAPPVVHPAPQPPPHPAPPPGKPQPKEKK